MTELEFQAKVIEGLAEIKTELKNTNADCDGFRRTLYGTEGWGGIVEEIIKLKQGQGLWNKLLAMANVGIGGAVAALAAWLKWGNK